MKTKHYLETVTCKRCKRELQSLNKSLLGVDKAMSKFNAICSSCVTDEELEEIVEITKTNCKKLVKSLYSIEK